MKKRTVCFLLCLGLLLCGCGGNNDTPLPEEAVETVDPYAGMVQVESGFGTQMWISVSEDVPVSPFHAADFTDGTYTGSEYTVRRGIDVSEHQGAIDWAAVAEAGVEFAILRAGYRGYGAEGTLREDAFFADNMAGAREHGLDVGIYFFSQATSTEEAVEEARYLLDLLSAYAPEQITLPVYFDWEDIGVDEARTDGLDGETITDCAAAFCQTVSDAGFDTGIYAYRYLGYFSYNLSRLSGLDLELNYWIGAVGDYPDFYYAHHMWQYSISGNIEGIEGDVDLDLLFRAVEP